MTNGNHTVWSKYLAEFVGTFFLVLTVGCNVLTGSVGAALSVGAILMVMIYSLYTVSGAHFNPAVTAAVKLSGRGILTWQDMGLYMVCQVLGAMTAGCAYSVIFERAFVMAPVGKFSSVSAGASEVIYTMALCYVVLNVATTQKQAHNEYFGLAIGFTVVSAALAIGGISGCCLNPAVALAATAIGLFSEGSAAMQHLYLFALLPFVGSGLAALGFRLVQHRDEYASLRQPLPESPVSFHGLSRRGRGSPPASSTGSLLPVGSSP